MRANMKGSHFRMLQRILSNLIHNDKQETYAVAFVNGYQHVDNSMKRYFIVQRPNELTFEYEIAIIDCQGNKTHALRMSLPALYPSDITGIIENLMTSEIEDSMGRIILKASITRHYNEFVNEDKIIVNESGINVDTLRDIIADVIKTINSYK